MKAAVFHGPRDVRIEDVPKPAAAAGEVVLRILRCAVCGTDKRIFTHGQKNVVPPAITGHEMVGELHQLGAGVKGLQLGQRAIVAAVIGCGQCLYCRRGKSNLCDDFTALGYDYPGGFAEYMKVPARAVAAGNIMLLPAGMSPDRAVLIEPLTCVLNGQEFLNARSGDRALVIGAGPIGLMHAGVLKARGCQPIVVADVSDERLAYVKEFGLGTPVNTSGGDAVENILRAAGGDQFDIAVTACSVKQAQADALRLVRKGARVSFFAGIPKDDPVVAMDTNHLHYNEISVFGAFGSDLRHYRQGIEMVARGDLPWDRFVTHRFKLADMLQAYRVIEAGQGLKTVIDCES